MSITGSTIIGSNIGSPGAQVTVGGVDVGPVKRVSVAVASHHGPAAIMVTGSSGFIGSHLTTLLSRRLERPIYGLDCAHPTGTPEFVPFTADIVQRGKESDLAAIAREVSPAVIVHLAARADVATDLGDISAMMDVNVGGTMNVLTAFNPRLFILASSGAVYGGAPTHRCEEDPLMPESMYGHSKLAAEACVRTWARKTGNRAYVLRFGNVIGPGCRGLIPYLVQHALQHPHGDVLAEMRGNGRLRRSYVPVWQVCYAIAGLIQADELAPGQVEALNVACSCDLTNGEVAAEVAEALHGVGLDLAVDAGHDKLPEECQANVLTPARLETVLHEDMSLEPAVVLAEIRRSTYSFITEGPCG